MKTNLKKILSLFLAAVICIGTLPLQVLAAGTAALPLPEAEIEADILRSDVFYIASPSAQLAEDSDAGYLLRVGRGGGAEGASSVHVRIADVTAKYGEDYVVRVYETGMAAHSSEDNRSLMEMMETQPYIQTELGTEEELAAMLEEDEEGQAVLNEGIQSAVDLLDEGSGLSEKYPDGYPAEMTDEVQQARAAFTGVQGASQRLTTQSDLFQDLQSVADVLTTAVVGADITLNFAPGESAQYLELIPENNRRGDGDRLFYLVLNSPEGGTTVSAADSCAVTIVDDEEQTPAEVSFSCAEYSLVPGEESVTVTVERSGAMNSVVSATVRTTGEGTAVAGRDYSEVERSLLFPFGVSSLTVDIPVRTEYFCGEADFMLSLDADAGCTVGIGSAAVTMTGTYAPKTMLTAAPKAALSASASTDRNSLSTVKTLDPIDISRPKTSGHQDNYYGGNNHYESGNRRWLLEWMDSTIWRDRKGTVGAVWQLSQDEGRYWIAGAQVVWDRTGSCAEVVVDIDGRGSFSSYFSDWKSRGDNAGVYDLYRSTADFAYETVNMYPTEASIREHYSFSPKWIGFYNRGRCDDCNRLWVYSISPILRPFQVNLKPAQPLKFLQPNGAYAADDGAATQASIVNSGDQTVCFLDESFTVTQLAGSNVQQYAKLSALSVIDESGNAVYTLGTNSDASVKSISFTLSKDALTDLKKGVGTSAFRDMIKENKFITEKTAGYPNYCEWNVRPVFDYIDASVTLHNPYDFPVTMVISGEEYTLAAHATKDLTYHLGDQLALTEIRLCGDEAAVYSAVGAETQFKRSGAEKNYESVSLSFVDRDAVYLGGSNTGDHRLCCREMTVEPKLQEKGNRILVRVRTDELSLFDRGESAGLLHQIGTVNGEYTELLLADTEQTVSGKLYAVTASPADSGYTCLWYDKNTNRYYEGSTLYFTAGAEPIRNVITLTAVPAGQSLTLSGTLRYMSYNLRTLDAGSVSAVPAAGAVVAAGSASAVADENGFFRTGALSVSGSAGRYLRYLVSVNGNALLQEALLPVRGGDLDLSDNFSDGVSPVSSDIFSNMQITAAYPASSGYAVEDGAYLPIVEGVAATVTVRLRPTDYTVMSSGASGVTEQTRTESPRSVILAVYDANGIFKGKYPAADCEYDSFSGIYSVSVPVDFALDTESGGSFSAAPGDRLYLRLTTDRMTQAGDGGEDYGYTYSDIYTGFAFVAPSSFEAPVRQGLESPVNIEYTNLPLIGTAGMNLNFPFVSVGWMKIDRGYRMYIGVSATQIYDAIKGTHISSFAGDDGMYWSSLFRLGDPFKSFAEGMKSSYSHITKGIGQGGISTGSLGSPQWRFDLQLGAYFDFYHPTVVGIDTDEYDGFYFAGVGFYMSATLGFKMAWYFVIPVVFIPAYIGIEIEGMVMGFLGAAASGKAAVSMDQARHEQVRFDDDLDEFSGSVRGVATAQLNLGVGLCGTLGIRAVGRVRLIGEYAPSDIVRDWGVYIGLSAGITVDLFLFSIPLVFELYNSPFGSFEDYVNGVSDDTKTVSSPKLMSAQNSSDPFRLRTGSETDSVWMGSRPILQSSLTPSTSRVLVRNAYERADAQLITLDNGTVVLAYIDSDNAKGVYQRTTLMLSAYRDGRWSEPVPVCEDRTADFQPSIAETKDGRVLVAWVSTGASDITEETATADYLRSMEVFAAFATVEADGSVTVGEPTQLTTGTRERYYDSAPTVVCDKVSGDAIVYYIKSGSTSENSAELANPYTNDCVVCYMYYNAEADQDRHPVTDAVQTVPAGWLTEKYYFGEYSGTAPNVMEWGGQRFLNGPTFEDTDGKTKYYTIPDFTAIGYNGLAVFAFTVDRDSSNDTDSDKELYLQVFNFAQHEMKYCIQLTDDSVSDALPQFFRAKDAGLSTDDARTHTKLFWYRDGKSVCYIDVTRLIREGINPNGSFIPHDEDYTDAQGRLHSHYAEPNYIGSSSDGGAAGQMADFRVAEDSSGSLYIVWTEGAADEDGGVTRQLFAMGLYATPDEYSDEQANGGAKTGNGGWSKPRQLTKGVFSCDEPAVTTCEDGLMVVHNRYQQSLNIQENSDRFEGVVDYDPIEISEIQLNATLMEPCGAVETEDIRLVYAEDVAEDEGGDASVILPMGGRDTLLNVSVVNNGLTEAEGYRLTLYAVQDGAAAMIGSTEVDTALMPASAENHSFPYTLPENVKGLSFRAVTQEKRNSDVYYANDFSYETEPLESKANYVISNVKTVQSSDGFRMRYTLTNNGNAAGENDTLLLRLNGPFNLDMKFDEDERLLYTGHIGTLAAGESRDYDVPVTVPAGMLEKYGFIDASACIAHLTADGAEKALSDCAAVQFALTQPMNMTVDNIRVAVNGAQTPRVSMALAQRFGGSDVGFSVEDRTIAAVRNGQIVGLAPGTTTLYATHTVSGAVVSATVTVTDDASDSTPAVKPAVKPAALPFADVKENAYYADAVRWAYLNKVTDGTDAAHFSPGQYVSRAQVVTFLWRAAGEPEPTVTDCPFNDVEDSKYYSKSVLWALENGITEGTDGFSFSPDMICTRAQIVTFLARFAGAENTQTDDAFSDVNSGKYFAPAVKWARDNGVTDGTSQTTFSPYQSCTRAQAVTFLYRWMVR